MNVFDALIAAALGAIAKIAMIVVPLMVGVIALYMQNTAFRKIINLINPPRNQARYSKNGKVLRSGYAFDESTGRWKYLNRDSSFGPEYSKKSGNRTYTVYQTKPAAPAKAAAK